MVSVEIIIAQHAGFCEGVERAYRIALEETKSGRPVYLLGNLVHNTQVIDKFKKLGVKTVKSLAEIPARAPGVLLISAHGVPPQTYTEAKDKGLKIVDTTCAWVKKAQKIAQELAAEDRLIIIVGDKDHPEVKGLVGWSQGRARVIERIEDLRALGEIKDRKVGVLAQTTQAAEHVREIVREIKKQVRDVRDINTICGATAKRQSAAIDLAKKVDLVLVIGDKMSANTKRLAELCTKIGTPTYQIQTAQELDPGWLTGKTTIGLTAGASTPDWVIKEVVQKLQVC